MRRVTRRVSGQEARNSRRALAHATSLLYVVLAGNESIHNILDKSTLEALLRPPPDRRFGRRARRQPRVRAGPRRALGPVEPPGAPGPPPQLVEVRERARRRRLRREERRARLALRELDRKPGEAWGRGLLTDRPGPAAASKARPGSRQTVSGRRRCGSRDVLDRGGARRRTGARRRESRTAAAPRGPDGASR